MPDETYQTVNRIHRIHSVLHNSVLRPKLQALPKLTLRKRTGVEVTDVDYYTAAVELCADFTAEGKEVFKARASEILTAAAAKLGVPVEHLGLIDEPASEADLRSPGRIYRAWTVCKKIVDDASLSGETVEVSVPTGVFRVPVEYKQAVDRAAAAGQDMLYLKKQQIFTCVFPRNDVAMAGQPTPPANPPVRVSYPLAIFTLLISAAQIAASDRTPEAAQRRERLDKLCEDYKRYSGL